MRRILAAMVGMGLVVGASPAVADDASRLKLAHAVVDTAHAGDNMRAVMPIMATQMRTMLTQQGNADTKEIDTYLKRFQQRFDEQIPQFTDLVAQVYAKEFSEEDLGKLLDFYRTPTGQHLLGKQQEIAKGMITVGQEWGKNVAQEVIAEMQKEKAAAPPPKL